MTDASLPDGYVLIPKTVRRKTTRAPRQRSGMVQRKPETNGYMANAVTLCPTHQSFLASKRRRNGTQSSPSRESSVRQMPTPHEKDFLPYLAARGVAGGRKGNLSVCERSQDFTLAHFSFAKLCVTYSVGWLKNSTRREVSHGN